MWKLLWMGRDKEHAPGIKSWSGDGGTVLRKHIHAGRGHGQKNALKRSLMSNNLEAQGSYLWKLTCILFTEF